MRFHISDIKENLVYIYFISILFESICFGSFKNFDFTITFVISLVLLIFSILEFLINGMRVNKRNAKVFFAFFLVLFLSVLFSKGAATNYNSLLLYIYYSVFFLFTSHSFDRVKFDKALRIFNFLVFILSIFAIYQFIAYNFITQLPLKELIPNQFLTRNYNTIAKTSVLNRVYYRAHSIYLEPSYLSQFNAISMLLLLNQKLNGRKVKGFAWIITIDSIAFILSLSGTGVVILTAGFVFFIIGSSMKMIKKVFLMAFLLIVALIFIPTEFGSYFIYRMQEVSFNTSFTSGYIRFIIPLLVAYKVLTTNFFGYGVGNDDVALIPFNINETRIANGYGKMIAETGPLGLAAMIYLLYSLKPKIKNEDLRLLFVILIVLNIVSANYVISIFWTFATVLNINSEKKVVAI